MRTRSSFGTSDNANSLVSRNRVVTARLSRSAYLGVGLMGDGQVASKRRLHRSQNVSTTATRAQKEDMHVTPVCFGPTLNRKGTTTHPACE